ncbi:hypothetical protein [Streptomyces sp. NPDC085596]
MAPTTRPRSRRLRAWLSLATDNWLSRGYLVVAGSGLAVRAFRTRSAA